MRNLMMAILLTSAAVSPALAQDNGRWHRGGQQTEQSGDDRAQARDERREARQQQDNSGARAQAVAESRQRQAPAQAEPQRGNWDRSRFEGRGNVAQQVDVQQQVQQQQARNGWRGNRGDYNGAQNEQVRQAQRSRGWTRDRSNWNQQSGDYRQQQAVQQQQTWDRTRSGTWDRTRSGTWDRTRSGTWDGSRSGSWSRDWRNDRRYDWRNYRNNHRSIFRLGVYFDPFGYGYRPYDIGYRLAPAYFGQQYWIDPAMYQLPYPPPGTQWVRYWNDAVLVDMYTGQVVDVIHDFFW